MPLLDHFRAPLRSLAPWTTLHGQWASSLMRRLNETLPPGYLALSEVHLGGQLQVDVGTSREISEPLPRATDNGGVATALWSPPQATHVLALDPDVLAVFEIRVLVADTMRLVAAIELVSPRNKDRPEARRTFVAKVAGYLQQQVSVIVVDVVTDRQADLQQELLSLLGLEYVSEDSSHLSATAYRITTDSDVPQLEIWPHHLVVGKPLPVVPLWLTVDQAIPVDLESTYRETLTAFRLPADD